MQFSDFIAILALLISGVSLFLSWRQYQRDRSHIQANITLENKYGELIYDVHLVNSGHRPASIHCVYARVRNGKLYPVYDRPVQLEETKTIDFTVPMVGFSKTPKDPDNIVAFEVEDSTGKKIVFKTHHSPKKQN